MAVLPDDIPPGPDSPVKAVSYNPRHSQRQLSDAVSGSRYNAFLTRAGKQLQSHLVRSRQNDWAMLIHNVAGQGLPVSDKERDIVAQALVDYFISNPDSEWNYNARATSGAAVDVRLPAGYGTLAELGARW